MYSKEGNQQYKTQDELKHEQKFYKHFLRQREGYFSELLKSSINVIGDTSETIEKSNSSIYFFNSSVKALMGGSGDSGRDLVAYIDSDMNKFDIFILLIHLLNKYCNYC